MIIGVSQVGFTDTWKELFTINNLPDKTVITSFWQLTPGTVACAITFFEASKHLMVTSIGAAVLPIILLSV